MPLCVYCRLIDVEVIKTVVRWLFLTFFAFLAGQGFAQYGNEWIKFNQQYFKIPVANDGIYRLSYEALQAAGFPSSADYNRIQLFHRGVEQSIRIFKSNTGINQLEPGDYIEFYGIKNTGVSDTELYKPANTQPHPYYNLYSDEAFYFLTVNTGAQLGKRMNLFSEVNIPPVPVETFHVDEKLMVLTSEYSTGIKYSVYIENSFFETGEGWTGDEIVKDESVDYTIENIVNTATSSGNPELEIQVVGRAEVMHRVEISVGPSSSLLGVIATIDFEDFNPRTITQTLSWSDIGSDGRTVVRVKALGVGATGDRLSTSYIKINYPQSFNLASASQKILTLRENAGNRSYIEIQNAPAGTKLFDVTDANNVVLIGTTATSTLNAVIPNTAISRKILATNSFTAPSISKISFRNIDPASHDYIIVSHPMLMEPAGTYSDPVKAYGAYRASPEGGSYDTIVADIHELYNQFNYGETSPLAISRFMSFMVNGGSPQYLFIIGKGLDVKYGYHRDPSGFTYHDLVPTAGMPASDIFYTAGLNGTEFEPAVPTGRITSNTSSDVAAYLNKVKEMESLPFNDLWRKEILHLSGGIYPGEPEAFESYLKGFADIAENFYLGGKTSAIAKTSTAIEFINISDKVNSGINLVTLFGHSSPSQNDFNIGFVSAPELGYENEGKYPMFLINGCNAGDFFATEIRYGEDWINTPAKGAVGFMANTSFGYSSILRAYSEIFYTVAYGDSTFIHSGIGNIQKEVVKRLTSLSSGIPFVTQAQQMLLLGDPAVKLFGASKPDYEINDDYVYAESYNGEPVTALSDSFAIKMIVRNFGRAKEDSITVQIVRTLNDNRSITYDTLFYPVLFSDTLSFTIYKVDKGFGNNIFSVTLDPFNAISELNKSNNTAELNMFIPLNAARNLYPQGFAIVNSPTVKLVVQSTNVLDEARDFVIQIDTVDTFDSQYAQEFTISGKIATMNFNLLPDDSLAYYWRSRLAAPLADESSDWAITSFTYIEDGPEGWAQVHFPQYLSSDVSGLTLDEETRLLRLKETITDVSIYTFGSQTGGYVTSDNPAIIPPITYHPGLSVKVGGTEYHPISLIEADEWLACRTNTINLIAFDKTTTIPYVANAIPPTTSNRRACGRRPEIIASFLQTEFEIGDNRDLISYVNNVSAGDSVILFSLGDPGYGSWSTNVLTKLSELGISSSQISGLLPGEPIIILAKKGSTPGSAVILKTSVPPANEQELEVATTVTGRYTSGTMKSTIIGPAIVWGNLKTQAVVSELPVTDEYSFDVIGVTLSGTETILKTGLTSSSETLSDIDAAIYPYLRLVFHAADETNLTAPQLKKWLVEYTSAPEGVITYAGSVETQNLKEGEVWTNTYGFYNISEKEFSDSLTVQYTVYNTTYRSSENIYKKIKAPAPGEETSFDIVVNTKEKAGINTVKVFVNPRVLPEVYYDNNVLELKDILSVEPDLFNPVLDVTIDGRYVLNGDYISRNPKILVKLWDENSFILKTDTVGVKIFLKSPCDSEECPFTQIFFTRPDVQWQPATSTSDFTVMFSPQNLIVGSYTLRIEATDVRDNTSGADPYEITVNVAEDNTIILQPPFPNPSSSTFNFQIVITGDIQIDKMDLEIIHPNGKIVGRGIVDEFFTGTNKITWDSSDLPNGLYLYRTTLTRDGKVIKQVNGRLMLIK